MFEITFTHMTSNISSLIVSSFVLFLHESDHHLMGANVLMVNLKCSEQQLKNILHYKTDILSADLLKQFAITKQQLFFSAMSFYCEAHMIPEAVITRTLRILNVKSVSLKAEPRTYLHFWWNFLDTAHEAEA